MFELDQKIRSELAAQNRKNNTDDWLLTLSPIGVCAVKILLQIVAFGSHGNEHLGPSKVCTAPLYTPASVFQSQPPLCFRRCEPPPPWPPLTIIWSVP